MKKHFFIWIFGILSSFALLVAQGAETVNILFWYIMAFILEIFMAYGVWLMIQEKHRSKWFLILPMFGGFLGSLIMYLIPEKKENNSIAQPNIVS